MGPILIVNADDFGLSPGVNAGILDAFRKGILRSASLLVNQPASEEAGELARQTPGLGVGVHLNLLRGWPVASPAQIPTLVDGEGRFRRPTAALARDIILGRIDLQDVRREFAAQVQRALAAGLRPTHLDSEKHLHMLPRIFPIAVEVARTFGVPALRCSRERLRLSAAIRNPVGAAKALVLRAMATLCRPTCGPNRPVAEGPERRRPRAEWAGRGQGGELWCPDALHGIQEAGRLDREATLAILDGLGPGVHELMTHPGYADETLRRLAARVGGFYLVEEREAEVAALTDPAVLARVREGGITLAHYGTAAR